MTNEEHAKMLLHRIGAMPYFDEQAIQKMIVDEFAIIKNEAATELETVKRERDAAKTMCAKAYFDIFGSGVRKEIYDAYGNELCELMHAAALKAGKA